MGTPLIFAIVERPVTSIVICFCTAAWFLIQKRQLGYADVGLSYDLIVHEGHYWRVLSAAFSHISVIHLLFNMTSLWSLGVAETLTDKGLGSVVYVRYSLILVLASAAVLLGIYHILVNKYRMEHFKHVTAVGYSCVVFGWMTIIASKVPSASFTVFGLLKLPAMVAPFESLVLTSIIVPQASFFGHLSGIVVGYLISWGFFESMNLYWMCVMAQWVCVGLIWSLKTSGLVELPFIQVEPLAAEDVLGPDQIPVFTLPRGEALV